MDNGDQMVGRVLTRREGLKLLAAASAAMLVGCGPTESGTVQPTTAATQAAAGVTAEPATVVATLEAAGLNEEAATSVATAEATEGATAAATSVATPAEAAAAGTTLPTCIVSPALTEGPYFIDEQLNRSDIRVNSVDGSVVAGASVQLAVRVSQISADGCRPLAGATVDIWHCDALGVYSGVSDNSQGFDITGGDFLRGNQVTDPSGLAQFTTIFPGWYRGRAVHIHFKVRAAATDNQTYEFTSQMFFEEALANQVLAQEPYASKGQPDTSNASDGIFQGGGEALVLALTPAGAGYSTTFDIGLDLSGNT